MPSEYIRFNRHPGETILVVVGLGALQREDVLFKDADESPAPNGAELTASDHAEDSDDVNAEHLRRFFFGQEPTVHVLLSCAQSCLAIAALGSRTFSFFSSHS